ncbi:hypothetical protein ACFS07_21760 [Undibacterium arcticum]
MVADRNAETRFLAAQIPPFLLIYFDFSLKQCQTAINPPNPAICTPITPAMPLMRIFLKIAARKF